VAHRGFVAGAVGVVILDDEDAAPAAAPTTVVASGGATRSGSVKWKVAP